MAQVVLAHCIPVKILGTEVPSLVDLVVTPGGNPGDGVVDVTILPTPGVISLPTGGAPLQRSITGADYVALHYRMSDGGPPVVAVTYSYVVP